MPDFRSGRRGFESLTRYHKDISMTFMLWFYTLCHSTTWMDDLNGMTREIDFGLTHLWDSWSTAKMKYYIDIAKRR